MGKSRSYLIRMAVYEFLDEIEKEKFYAELADAYAANSEISLDIANMEASC
jgi:hypothetical protein